MKKYKLIEEKFIKSEDSLISVLEHIKTKAKILLVKNKDNNKLFSIGFRTPPKDSSGVCHILEHCVLNGSKKYTTKEPFMDMIKTSLQTFLNAMTYSDKTIYPVASRNTKDFENLMDLYLDAVFNPKVKTEEKIFLQEGWRYHLNEKDEIEYKGVVYNEMKGAMSSAEDQVYENITKHLFPDSIYGLNSGGDPYKITNLKYEDFLNYYDNFYHPSNSYIILYGDMDYDKYLEYIDNEYLKNYEFKQIDSKIEFQKRFESPKFETCYFNTMEDNEDSYISYSVLTPEKIEYREKFISSFIVNMLIYSDSSPIKKKLFDLGIVKDILNTSSYSILENYFSMTAKGIEKENRDLFVSTIELELKNIVKNGIDKELAHSTLNQYKFFVKEKSGYATKGIVYATSSFNSWLYDDSPLKSLDLEPYIEYLEKNLENGIIEDFIENNILKSNHKSILVHLPMKNLNKNKDLDVSNKLKKLKNSLSEKDMENLRRKNEKMEEFQNRENTEEEKNTIPKLSLDDLNYKIEQIPREIVKLNETEFVLNKLSTSGIDYLNISFDISHLSYEEIPYMSIICEFLGMIGTKNYDAVKLNNKISLETGGIFFTPTQYKISDSDEIKKRINLSVKFFSNNSKKAVDIIREIVLNSDFDDKKKIKELINMLLSKLDSEIFDNGHIFMINRAFSSQNKYFKYYELVKGIDFHLFVKKLSKMNIDDVINNLISVYKKLFFKEKLVVNIGSKFEYRENLIEDISNFIENLNTNKPKESVFEFVPQKIKEAFSSSANVQYVGMGGKFENYSSEMEVVENIISNNYLYLEIRAKGGAYGTGIRSNRIGCIGAFSYRDPNLKKTLETYLNVPHFLESLEINEKDLLPIIIGSAGKLDPAMSDSSKASFDFSLYMSNRTYEDLNDEIKAVTLIDVEKIKNHSEKIKNSLESASIAVLGNKDVIEKNKELFDVIIKI